MNKRWFLATVVVIALLAIVYNLGQAQTTQPASVIVCAKKADGALTIVPTEDDCKDRGIVLHMYTQSGVDSQFATTGSSIASLTSQLANIQAAITSLTTQVNNQAAQISEQAAQINALSTQINNQAMRIATLEETVAGLSAQESRLAAVEDKLVHFSRNGNDVTITGANLHIVNGTGDTNSTNGLGNMIIGYNERQVLDGACQLTRCNNIRTGSHNLVIGRENNFASYGGIVSGEHNWIAAPFASVTAGRWNVAWGPYSSVTGGIDNRVEGGSGSSISGGNGNTINGTVSSISGGYVNTIEADNSSVSGGVAWLIQGRYYWAAGDFSDDDSDQIHHFP